MFWMVNVTSYVPFQFIHLHLSCNMKWSMNIINEMINIISDSAAVPSDWTGAHYCSWERVLRQDSRNARNQRWVTVKYVLVCKVQENPVSILDKYDSVLIMNTQSFQSQHTVLCPSCFECCFTYNSNEEGACRGQLCGSHLNHRPKARGELSLEFSKKRNKVAPMDSDQDAVSVHVRIWNYMKYLAIHNYIIHPAIVWYIMQCTRGI